MANNLWYFAQMKYDEFKAEQQRVNTSCVSYNQDGRSNSYKILVTGDTESMNIMKRLNRSTYTLYR